MWTYSRGNSHLLSFNHISRSGGIQFVVCQREGRTEYQTVFDATQGFECNGTFNMQDPPAVTSAPRGEISSSFCFARRKHTRLLTSLCKSVRWDQLVPGSPQCEKSLVLNKDMAQSEQLQRCLHDSCLFSMI